MASIPPRDVYKRQELTPREIVKELDRYIIGQDEAKRSVAVALRNRYRRKKLPSEMQEEVIPKNILMIGSTGVCLLYTSRFICDREQEIESFVEEEYWTLEALLTAGDPESAFKALLAEHRGEKIELKNQEQADAVVKAVQDAQFTVDQVKKSRRLRRPSPPFTTSSLQQEASSRLGFTCLLYTSRCV